MGILKSLFGRNTNAGQQLAELCFTVREQMNFLDDYIASGKETGDALQRLEFSKDVIMMFIGASIVEMYVKSAPKALQINDDFRRIYLALLSLPPSSRIGNCLVRDDEIKLVAERVAPGTPIQKLRSGSMSTADLMMVVGNIRSPQFRRDLLEGALLTQQRGGFLLWLPAAKSFLSQIRGVSVDAVSFDDANHLCIAIHMPFGMISSRAQEFLQ